MQITLLPEHGLFTGARRFMADAIFPEGKDQRDQSERLANIDPLTGLANRRAFDRAQPTAEADEAVAVILFDANNFGTVNKQLGHDVGDGLLRNMAQVLQLAASRHQVAVRAFRLGGDEFVILCPADIAEKVRDLVEQLYLPLILDDGTQVSISGTIGRTLAEADQQLQDRKTDHKNNIILL